jgi:sulfur carrier protein ThiS
LDTISPATLNWCADKIDTLYDFLEQKNTKGFVVLKDGKIVLEKYFGTFNEDSLWYWASA